MTRIPDRHRDYADEAYDDERYDAMQEARRDELEDRNDLKCSDCEITWWSMMLRATLEEPADCRHPECPNCGMPGEPA